jgi:SSS family solute:Na+ symporter
MIVFSVLLSYSFSDQPAIIARSTAIFFALCASVFLPAYIGGLFWKRMTKEGAIASMVTGCVISTFWLVFVHFNEAKQLGVSKALFGVDSLLSGKIIFVDAMIIALPASALVAVAVSLLTKPNQELIEKCFKRELAAKN